MIAMNRIYLPIMLGLLFVTLASAANEKIIYVDDDAVGKNDGTSWQNAFRFLQDALANANEAEKPVEIRVAQGIYKPYNPDQGEEITLERREQSFLIISNVTIKGGYAGVDNTNPNLRDHRLFHTILSGDLSGNDPSNVTEPNDLYAHETRQDNAYHVVLINQPDESVFLDGLVISGGNANGSDNAHFGGGILIIESYPSLTHCIFKANAAGNGAGVFSYQSSPHLQGCTFDSGYAEFRGGGFSSQGPGEPNLIQCIFTDNNANDAGGAVHFFQGSGGYVKDCTFVQNTAHFGGGALSFSACPLFQDCRFENNSADVRGGAVYNVTKTEFIPEFYGCHFEANTAEKGGAFYNESISVTITSCVFERNHSGQSGGAIYNDHSYPVVNRCTFLGNTAGVFAGYNVFPGPRKLEHDLDPPLFYVFPGYGPDGGAIYNYECGPTMLNSAFALNCAQNLGGAIFNYAPRYEVPWSNFQQAGKIKPHLVNCTLWGNIAAWGGDMWNDSGNAEPNLTNCIVWSNLEFLSRRTPRASFRGTNASHSNIEGGWPGDGNINTQPLLSPHGYLYWDSPCIDTGDPNFVTDPNYPKDVHNEERKVGQHIDIGADEFVDSDGDGLPDWWEMRYFNSIEGADPNDDSFDGDGLPNIDEYEIFASNPISAPIYVDANTPHSKADGTSTFPFSTIQQALDAANNGDTIFVESGIYAGVGNYNLDFHHKSLILQNTDKNAKVIIDCNGLGRAIEPTSTAGANVLLEGFTIENGFSDIGGALRMESGRFILQDCLLSRSSAVRAGTLGCSFSNLIISSLDIERQNYHPAEPNTGEFRFANVYIEDQLCLGPGIYEVVTTQFDGPGNIVLKPNAHLKIMNYSLNEFSSINTNIFGPGVIEIEPGQQLTFEGDTQINLLGNDVEPPTKGTIRIGGSLVISGNASVKNAHIIVLLLDVDNRNTIVNNDIRLLEASTGFGGEFFVSGNATVSDNNIESEGDRYLDLDPNPREPNRPTISNNKISVVIKQGKGIYQGTLLELRAKDYDAGGSINPMRASGAYSVSSDSEGFTDNPSENWVLEKLTLKQDAKLNLTNRQGFRYQDQNDPHMETVYVKELVMEPNSVLNTALQTLYYQNLLIIDSHGNEIARNPIDMSSPFPNGAEFKDIPLLGFSLGIIAMDHNEPPPHNEFDIRVRKRLVEDPNDPTVDKRGRIERIVPDPNIYPGMGGVMEMCTDSVISIAAKGAFARAGNEDITIEFEYMFRDDPYDEAELIVYLSDHPEVSKQLRQVARIRPPSHGRPGSVGSNQFAIFSGKFPKGNLNFTRGTYVELELRGPGACCWIDNWDPRIYCPMTCRDYDGSTDVDMTDYLLVLAESGMKNPANANKGCLDLMTDGVVDLGDAVVWETYHRKDFSIECPKAGNDDSQEQSRHAANMYGTMASKPLLNNHDTVLSGPLVMLAKGGIEGGYVTSDSNLYEIDSLQKQIKGRQYDGTGRLVTDKEQNVYCIDPIKGLVWLDNDSEQVIVAPKQDIEYGNRKITIGFFEPNDAIISDAVFHPEDPNIVYIVPVRVVTDKNVSYKAAVKLDLDTNKDGKRGDISILRLYGDNPDDISSIEAKDPLYIVGEPDYQHLREVELDADGNNLFVLSACSTNKNNWILAYEARSDDPQGWQEDPNVKPLPLNDPNIGVPDLSAPSSMLVSSAADRIYMASSAREPVDTNNVNFMNDLETKVYCFSFTKTGRQTIDGLYYEKTIFIDFNEPQMDESDPLKDLCTDRFMSFITSMAEDLNGTLYVTGYSMPEFGGDAVFPDSDTLAMYGAGWFMTPVLATIPTPGTDKRYRTEDIGTWDPDKSKSLSLPLSIVWTGKQMDSNNYVLNRKTNINIQSVNFLAEKWLNPSY